MTPGQEHLAFYSEIGLTLTQWSNIERGLLNVAATCLPDANYTALHDGYYSIENFRSKLAFVNALVCKKHALKSWLSEWEALKERITRLSVARNKLAHYGVIINSRKPAGLRYRLCDSKNNSLALRDIVEIRLKFFAAFIALDNLEAKIRRKPPPNPANLESPLPTPSLLDIERQMQSIFLGPSLSSRQ